MNKDNIKFMKGDILSPNTTDGQVIICHQVNCKGVMGAGLAKQIRAKFPSVYEEYKNVCAKAEDSKDLLGTVLYCPVNEGENETAIANIFGQDKYGTGKVQTDYNALRRAMADVCATAMQFMMRTPTVVRIPYKMGCGLAGGDWSVVYEIIMDELVSKDVPVEIWHLPK